MMRGWLKPLIVSLAASFLVSVLFVVSTELLLYRDSHTLYLRFVERSARVIAMNGQYAENLQRIGPLPTDGSGFLGRVWIVSSNGTVLASSSHAPLPKQAARLLPEVDRSAPHPFEAKMEQWSIGADLFLLPMPGHPADTFVVQNMRRGPMLRWMRSLVVLVFVLTSVLCLAVWAIVMTVLRHRSCEARAVMQAIAQGELNRRLLTGKLDEISGLSLDFNAMADRIEELVRQLTKAEEARSEVLRHLAHDIRTPLTSLRTATETLTHAHGLDEKDRMHLVQVAHAEALYLGRLVEDLFFISELGARAESKEPVDLAERTRSLLAQRRLASPHPQVHWELDIQDGGLVVELDQVRFTRLLCNLLDNAEKYARQTVRVSLHSTLKGIRLAVGDDGPGMSAEAIERYGKDRSRRIDVAHAGTSSFGLGSAIVRSIVEHWNGKLLITNRPVGGLDVAIELPLLPQRLEGQARS